MLPREMRTDVMPGASGASSPADESDEAAGFAYELKRKAESVPKCTRSQRHQGVRA